MKRYFALLAAIAVAVVLTVSGCPNPVDNTTLQSGDPSKDYYPLASGNTWHYTVTNAANPADNATHTVTCGELITFNGQQVFNITCVNSKDGTSYSYKNKVDGACLDYGSLDAEVTTVNTPANIEMPATLTAGYEWTQNLSVTETPVGGGDPEAVQFTKTSTVVGVESVTVPAGTFSAVKIHQVFSVVSPFPNSYAIDLWLAPGVGPVKWMTVTETIELTSSSLVGQDPGDPQPGDPQDYFPLAVGKSWNFSIIDTANPVNNVTQTVTCNELTTYNGQPAFKLTSVHSQHGTSYSYANKVDGAHLSYGGSFTNSTYAYAPARIEVPATMTAGYTWSQNVMETETPAGGAPTVVNHALTSTVVGTESVIVPAGTYTAIKIHQTDTATGAHEYTDSTDIWLAAGVGPVKITHGTMSLVLAN